MFVYVIKDGWMTYDFTSFTNGISVISEQWQDDNERMCTIELRLRLKRFRLGPLARFEPGTARSVGQRLICLATAAPV